MLWYGFEVWSSLLVFQNAYLEWISKVPFIKQQIALVLSKALINVGSTYIVSTFIEKLFIHLCCISIIKKYFFHSEMFFSSFLLLITTNTSCHPLHELFRKNSYVHYIITLENVKKFWFLYLIDIINVRIAFKYYYY